MSLLPTRLLACLLVVSLAGCATPIRFPGANTEGSPIPANARVSDRNLNALLAYYQDIKDKPERTIENERKFYQAAATAGRCDAARVQLGMALLRSAELGIRIEGSDNVMQPCMTDTDLLGSNVYYLAHLIQAQLRTHRTEQSRYQNVVQETDSLKKENMELRRQVEGLKAIERSLQDRRRRGQESSSGADR